MFESFLNLFRRSPKGDGKAAMAEKTEGAIDMAALGELIKTSTAAAVADAVKPLNDRLAKFETEVAAKPAAVETAKAADTTKQLTEADVDRLVEQRLKAAQTSQQNQQARDKYLADQLKDLPGAYRDKLGSDPAKWADEQKSLRDQFKADFASAGGKVADVGGVPNVAAATVAGATAAGGAVNLDGRSASQNISAGLAQLEKK